MDNRKVPIVVLSTEWFSFFSSAAEGSGVMGREA
jgi:hypothetical protein